MEFTFDEMMAEVRTMTRDEMEDIRSQLKKKKITDKNKKMIEQYMNCINLAMAEQKLMGMEQ